MPLSDYPWGHAWDSRSKRIAKLIPPRSTVLDIGGGFETLKKYLANPRRYVSTDIDKWTDDTVVFDLNSHPYPELGRFDYIVVAGVVEYVKNATMFFSGLRKYGDVIVMTFLSSQSKVKGRNLRTLEEINKCISRAGWEVVIKEDYTDSHRLMILRKIYAKKTVVLGE